MNTYTIFVFLITYLICSISPSIILCKKITGEDIRNLGSGNAGTTNAIRVLGKPIGFLVFVLDIVKVLISYGAMIGLASIFKESFDFGLQVFIVASVLGHCYPIYYTFKGGKGVAVSIVVAFLINSQLALVCVIAGIFIILITRMVSLASIAGIILFDIMIFVMMPKLLVPVFIISCIILFKHRSNIERILEGQENKLF